ncbi:MAG: glutamine amidotransferase-related protein, partial [Alphaproteobacteria bacterium]
MIVVVDYGMGNIRSVLNACEALGAAAKASASPADLIEARGLILPGVGAFGDGMAGLRARGLDDAVTRLAREQGRPLLGICLGMQLLAARAHLKLDVVEAHRPVIVAIGFHLGHAPFAIGLAQVQCACGAVGL